MLRLIPLLAFATLPAVVAAPVPPGGRVEFGTNGLLSHADLEKVKFDSRPTKEKGAEPKPENGPRKFDVAVHMPWARFREGEPMPAYFVLRNNTDEILGLDAQLSLYGPHPTVWNSCSFSLRPLTPDSTATAIHRGGWRCGGGPLVDVPANGFYCVKADMNRIHGSPLSPGEYEVEWRYSHWKAAPVKFTVVKTDAKPSPTTKPLNVRFYSLSPDSNGDNSPPKEPGESIVWRDSSLGSTYTDQMAAALSVGQNGVYAPDIHAIPTADKFVEAWVEWKPYRDGDRVAVTLRAVPPYECVRFEELPKLFLQIESSSEDLDREFAREARAERKLREESLATPLTIEVRLPHGWRERVATDSARVAVLVTAKPIEFPTGNLMRIKEAAHLKRVSDAKRNTAPVWNGIVRTEFTELRFPPPPPARKLAP